MELLNEIHTEIENCFDEVGVYHLKSWDKSLASIVVFVEDSLAPKDVIASIYHKKINHLVQKNQDGFADDLKLAASLLQNPKQYFDSGLLFINPAHSQSLVLKFSRSDEKEDVINKSIKFIEPINSPMALHGAIVTIEELCMNALIDAPKEAKLMGTNTDFKECQLELSYNDKQLQICCTDPYGSLDLDKLISRMHEVYQLGVGDAIRLEGDGGAGIGCYLLFEQCSTMILGVQKGVKTKVSCFIPLKMSNRKKNQIKKNIHRFQI